MGRNRFRRTGRDVSRRIGGLRTSRRPAAPSASPRRTVRTVVPRTTGNPVRTSVPPAEPCDASPRTGPPNARPAEPCDGCRQGRPISGRPLEPRAGCLRASPTGCRLRTRAGFRPGPPIRCHPDPTAARPAEPRDGCRGTNPSKRLRTSPRDSLVPPDRINVRRAEPCDVSLRAARTRHPRTNRPGGHVSPVRTNAHPAARCAGFPRTAHPPTRPPDRSVAAATINARRAGPCVACPRAARTRCPRTIKPGGQVRPVRTDARRPDRCGRHPRTDSHPRTAGPPTPARRADQCAGHGADRYAGQPRTNLPPVRSGRTSSHRPARADASRRAADHRHRTAVRSVGPRPTAPKAGDRGPVRAHNPDRRAAGPHRADRRPAAARPPTRGPDRNASPHAPNGPNPARPPRPHRSPKPNRRARIHVCSAPPVRWRSPP
ncbi:hypothetical protein NRB20_60910 [Nocardia sp. RB20]|uniref:Uncharacterized protein n=1 Tax=Nocardia macrotermitis TaxID=2585198 RepID=A0A7K0DB63_9NOCA|nr:hypothetical protein [Nocardia macrotermitis]